jgi:hypothetical protein
MLACTHTVPHFLSCLWTDSGVHVTTFSIGRSDTQARGVSDVKFVTLDNDQIIYHSPLPPGELQLCRSFSAKPTALFRYLLMPMPTRSRHTAALPLSRGLRPLSTERLAHLLFPGP